jgi:hypothetical protein
MYVTSDQVRELNSVVFKESNDAQKVLVLYAEVCHLGGTD